MLKNFFKILDKKNQLNVVLILLLYFPLNIIEAISLSAIPGFILFIIDPEKLYSLIDFKNMFFNLDQITEKERIIYASIFLIFVFLFRALSIFLINFFDYKTRLSINLSNSKKLYSSYLFRPYSFHTKNDSSSLIQNVSDVIKSTNVIFSYVNIVKDILLLIFILILIFKTLDFTYFLSLLLIFIPVLTLLLIIKNKIKNLGEVARDFRVATHKSLLESLTSIKFLQVSNTQKDFIQNFIKKLSVSQKGDFKLSIINLLPKSIIEISALLFIVTFMIYNSLGTGSFQSLLPSLSFIVIASIRIIPSLTQISININNIKYNSYTIPKVCHEIIYWNEKSNVALNIQSKNIIKEFKNSVKIENLNFSYVEDRTLIENFNLDIDKGSNVGITGESGVGKSTLIDLILGLIDPIKGEIICDNQNIKDDIFGWRNQVSFVPQDIVLLDTTIKENIILDFNYKKFNKTNYESALKISGLDNVIKKFKNADETDIGSFSSKISGGQKQRIGIARAIYLNRPIIILDESTNSLNNDAEEEIINNLLNSDYTIILISHNQKLINKCEKKVKL